MVKKSVAKPAAKKKPPVKKQARPAKKEISPARKETSPAKKETSPAIKKLLKLREEILAGIGITLKSERGVSDRDVGDFYDDVDMEKVRQLTYTLGERERAKLNAIEAAIEKIKDGTYGLCEECGTEINKKRLKILPFARYCISCQSDLERQNKFAAEETEENLLYKDISVGDIETEE